MAENFCYLDNAAGTANVLNRLTNYSVNSPDNSCTDGPNPKTIAYGNDGNILSKSDVGSYSYGAGYPGPHAVTSITTNSGVNFDGIANPNFLYDTDGNVQCVTTGSDCSDPARSYSWTTFDMVEQIAQGNNTASLVYDPEHRRGTQYQHAFIVITDNLTGEQWISQAEPDFGALADNAGNYSLDVIDQSWTEAYISTMTGYGGHFTTVSNFTTNLSSQSVLQSLVSYGNYWNASGVQYSILGPNSNTYAQDAWQSITGSIPQIPSSINAPGWYGQNDIGYPGPR